MDRPGYGVHSPCLLALGVLRDVDDQAEPCAHIEENDEGGGTHIQSYLTFKCATPDTISNDLQ